MAITAAAVISSHGGNTGNRLNHKGSLSCMPHMLRR